MSDSVPSEHTAKPPTTSKAPKKKKEKKTKEIKVLTEHILEPTPASTKPVRKKRKIKAPALPLKNDVIGRFWSETPLKPVSRKLLKQLDSFFTDKMLEELIVHRSLRSVGDDANNKYHSKKQRKGEKSSDDVKERWSISLRCLEWLVTNYAKKHQIVLYHTEKKQRVNIYSEYLDQLNLYKRMRFDPFCRSQRIYFSWSVDGVEMPLPTTVGQLNFMRWAYITGVLEYAQTNENTIQKDMEDVLAVVQEEKRAFKNSGQKRKRKELSQAPDTYCNVYTIDTVLFGDNNGEVL